MTGRVRDFNCVLKENTQLRFDVFSFINGRQNDTHINTKSLIDLNHVCMSYRYTKTYTT